MAISMQKQHKKMVQSIIAEKEIWAEDEVTVVLVEDSRKALAIYTANYYNKPADKLSL